MNLLNVINQLNTQNILVLTGYLMNGESTKRNCITSINLSVGSSYQNGNESESFINLNNIGPFHGNLVLNDISDDIDEIIYNYLTSLIPGQFPSISGPSEVNTSVYNLTELQNQTDPESGIYFCKVLGLGQGQVSKYKVANINQNAISKFDENFVSSNVTISLDFDDSTIIQTASLTRQINYSNTVVEYVYPQSELGALFYIQNLNWANLYEISQLNGTNIFPSFSWGGSRIGTVNLDSFQIQQDTLYNYPSNLLLKSPGIPIGVIYAGQGVQISNFDQFNNTMGFKLDERNEFFREYKNKLSSGEINNLIGIQPYQQGRGIFEFVSREPEYTSNGSVNIFNIISTFPPEGIQPGRNNGFLGVSLTDFFSDNLNLQNQEASSVTQPDTVKISPLPTKASHNAPLVYETDQNIYEALPWSSLNTYASATTNSIRQNNCPILTDGITTMIISGSYPLYRGSGFSDFSGFSGLENNFQILYFSNYLSQYYVTSEFWNPNNTQGNIPQGNISNQSNAVPPNPPYRIKAGRIILYENQRVTAGSYVYSTIGMTGNTNMSKYFAPSAKEIILDSSFRNILNADLYAKYQSNQGGLIVIAVGDDETPTIPPNAQPIGIILEDITGTGTPQEQNGQTYYDFQFNISSGIQTFPESFESTLQLQNREVLIYLFPMFGNLYSSGFPSTYDNSYNPVLTTVSSNLLLQDTNFFPNPAPASPLHSRIRNWYTITDSKYSYEYISRLPISQDNRNLLPSKYTIKDKELSQDWPGPESRIL